MRKWTVIILALVLTSILAMIGGGCGERPEVIVGNKNFTEQYIIGEMIKQLLEERGFTVRLTSGHSSSYLREAIEFGDIDVYAEYTGTALMVYLGHTYESEKMDNGKVYKRVQEEDEEFGIIWLNPIWNNNTFVLGKCFDWIFGLPDLCQYTMIANFGGN